MKKIYKLFLLMSIMLCSILVFASCDEKTTDVPTSDVPSVTVTPTQEKTPKDILKEVIFSDKEVEYDGKPHSLVIENAPEGVEVTYNRKDLTDPGSYKISAKMEYMGAKLTKYAYLTITKAASVLNVQESYTYYYYEQGDFTVIDGLNNAEQELVYKFYSGDKEISKSDIYTPGTYKCEVYAKENEHYTASEVKTFTLTTYKSLFDVEYNNSNVVYDGNSHSIELTGSVPAGYTVSYENNSGTEPGNYFAVANIKDSSGKVVETHRATLVIDYPHNEAFETYLDEFLVEYIEGDQLSVNIFFEKPEDFGLEHYEATWYEYGGMVEDDGETINQFKELLDELHAFDSSKLNSRQKSAYNRIDDFLSYYYEYYQIEDVDFQKIVYVDQFGGYVADFGTYMEAYTLRSEQEVKDVISYINSTLTAFPSYVQFVKDKASLGYALSDFTITEMRLYLSDVLADHDPENDKYYYLKDVLCGKIDKLDFLSDSQKESYKNDLIDAICNSFIPGVKALDEGLKDCLGLLEEGKEGYWSVYENGVDLYKMELEDLLGLNNFDIDKFKSEVTRELKSTANESSEKINDLIKKYGISSNEDLDELLASFKIFDGTPEEMLVFLKDFAKSIVPELDYTPVITVKEMDEASAKVSNAVAYYMKSAVDNFESEFITLNPTKLGDSNDVLGTLSHEGYPGHLYAYCFTKQSDMHEISKIMTSTAHGEGWATYVELKLYEYAYERTTDEKERLILEYLIANHKSAFLLETRIDLGIHYENWDTDKIASFLEELGYSSSYAEDIYKQMIEMPTTYAAYGYGKYFFMKLHNEAKKILGKFYNEVEFNAMLLSKGWTDLGELENTYNEYMTITCHKFNIEYTA